MASRVFSRISRSGVAHRLISGPVCRTEPLVHSFHPIGEPSAASTASSLIKAVSCQSNQILRQRREQMLTGAIFQNFGFSSFASTQATEKEANQCGDQNHASQETPEAGSGADPSKSAAEEQANDADLTSESKDSKSHSYKRRRTVTKRPAFSDSDEEPELSMDDLVKLVAEKEELLKLKHKEIEKMQDKVLRSYAEMENVIDRTKREAENSKKFAVQNFAKSLLDVADNLGRASSVVKESFSKIDASKDTAGAVPLLKTLLDGVEMTDKHLAEAFKKFGVEKFDPMNELFDPHRHLAVFQVPDPTKPHGTVAVVIKPGYMLYDRVIRPAEVGVTEASNKESDESSNE